MKKYLLILLSTLFVWGTLSSCASPAENAKEAYAGSPKILTQFISTHCASDCVRDPKNESNLLFHSDDITITDETATLSLSFYELKAYPVEDAPPTCEGRSVAPLDEEWYLDVDKDSIPDPGVASVYVCVTTTDNQP